MNRWTTTLCLCALISVPLLAQQEERITVPTATYSWTSDEGDNIGLPDPSPTNIDMPGLDSVHLAVIPDGPVFYNGFQSGDLSGWTSSLPSIP